MTINESNNQRSTLKNIHTPILIVGGGHVGLSLALLLADKGLPSTLLEQNQYPQISPDDDIGRTEYLDCRNTALSRRTVQIYQRIGLWENLQSHACRIDQVKISELGSFGTATLKKEEEGLESFGYVMENAWLGRELLLSAQHNPLITVIDNAEVVAVSQDTSMVSVSYKREKTKRKETNEDAKRESTGTARTDTEEVITSALTVACDGRDSVIRNILGISAHKHDYKQSAIVGVVTTDTPHNHVGIERFSPVGPLAVLPLTDAEEQYRRSVVWICDKGAEQRYLDDDEYFLQTLQETFGEQAGTFLQAGRRGMYPLTKVLAKRQVQGRCVIMGNAAHTLHPVAGQGFNLCMRDADNFATMISELSKEAQQSSQDWQKDSVKLTKLLTQYEKSRKKDQKRVIHFCDFVVYGFSHPNPVVKFTRNLSLLAFDKVPNIKPLVATYAMGLKS